MRPNTARTVAILLVFWGFASGPSRSVATLGAQSTVADSANVDLPASALNALAGAARGLAKRGHDAPSATIILHLTALGYPEKKRAALEKERERALARAKTPSKNIRSELRKLADFVRIARRALAATTDANARNAIARAILAIDDQCAEARERLGHVKSSGEWIDTATLERRKRRRAIQDAVQRARKLAVPLQTNGSRHPFLARIGASEALAVTAGPFTVIGTVGAVKLERLVRDAMRMAALSSFLRGGPLTAPTQYGGELVVAVESKAAYLAALDRLVAAGHLPAEQAKESAEHASVICPGNVRLTYLTTHTHRAAFLLLQLSDWQYGAYGGRVQPCLLAGHLNWICLSYLGDQSATLIPNDETDERVGAYAGAEGRKRKSMRRMAGAGIVGSRSWMRYLAVRGEDPAWSHSMVSQLGLIRNDNLLKTTFVVEYLQEIMRFVPLLSKSAGGPDHRALMTKALDEPLAAFEGRWRAWLLGQSRGLVQRLNAPPPPKPSPDAVAALKHLNGLRKAGWDRQRFDQYVDVELDPSLSNGAARHAVYLKRHPEQLSKWPDAHEEYPDQEGFSPAGSWAGGHSVIAPGVQSSTQAIHGWMGTFYHRLPLLVPGLIRIGVGFEHGISVLDAGSISHPGLFHGHVAWPHDRMKNVPLAFRPELPNPVPGEDQSRWGYPITLQFFSDQNATPTVRMQLFQGRSANGKPVPAHEITPAEPKNVELAPAGAFCLIPLGALAPRADYTVVATPDEGETITWTFRTR